MRRDSFTILRSRITHKINSCIVQSYCCRRLEVEVRSRWSQWVRRERQRPKRPYCQEAATTFQRLASSMTGAVPEGADTHSSLQPFILFITLRTNDCLSYYKRWMLVTTLFISIYSYNTVVCVRHLPHLPLLCSCAINTCVQPKKTNNT